MKDYLYDISSKDNCWYKDICDKSRCGECFCIRHYKMDCLVHMALLEGKLAHPPQLRLDKNQIDLEPYKKLKDIQSDINNFVNNGKNLMIYSENTGNGKSSWAQKLLLSWLDSIWVTSEFECRGMFVSLPKLMNSMKENLTTPNDYFKYVNDNIRYADLVVWDELNYKDYTQFEYDYILDVINQRISEGKSNIFTTNYSLPVIEKKLGTRLASRVLGSSMLIEFKGADKRGLNL